MNRKLMTCAGVSGILLSAIGGTAAAEEHVEGIVRDVAACVARLKVADPEAVPMAFWDFDGTIIKGDISFGLEEEGEERYPGLVKETICAGFSRIYRDEQGYRKWNEVDYPRLAEIGAWLSQGFDAQMYAGADVNALDAFCERRIREGGLDKWYFTSSMEVWKALEKLGVENYVVSANVEALVRNAAPSLGISRERIRGVRVENIGGRWSTQLVGPVPHGEGKVDVIRQIVRLRAHGHAVAGFGDSYATDGPFLREIAVQRLPGTAQPVAVMINGGDEPANYHGLFRLVRQVATVGML